MPRSRASDRRRIILATNIAETSLTVPGVSAVIDTGQVKVARYDAERGVDSLTLERITTDSAEQRAGRAARLGPGLVRRLWDARDRLRPHREPEIARVDLAGPVLDCSRGVQIRCRSTGSKRHPTDRIHAALRLLRRLGAIDGEAHGARITPLGRQLQRVPLHPRLARILIDGSRRARGSRSVRDCMGVDWVRGVRRVRADATVRQVAQELQRVASSALDGDVAAHITDEALRHALFTGYADRLAKRRPGSHDRFLLASGHGAALAREAAAVDGEYIVALDVVAAEREGDQRVENPLGQRSRARVDTADVDRTSSIGSMPGAAACAPRASSATMPSCSTKRRFRSMPPRPSALLGDAWLAREHDAATTQLLRRLRFAGSRRRPAARSPVQAAASARSIDEIDLEAHLPFELKRALADRAPASIVVPSGRTHDARLRARTARSRHR